jgi:hypothetical protein
VDAAFDDLYQESYREACVSVTLSVCVLLSGYLLLIRPQEQYDDEDEE